MKKGITILIAALIVFGAGIGVAVAEEENKYYIDAGEILKISGNGTINREVLAQSGWGYNGQRLTEDLYSLWFGTDGKSNIDFNSDLSVYIGMSDEHEDEEITEISYGQTSRTTNVQQTVCLRNYEVGAASGWSTRGDSMKAFEAEMFPDSNYLDLEGIFDGKTKLRHVVVDPDAGLKIIKETTEVKGLFEIDWEAYADKLLYPGDDLGDWLGCP